MNASPLAAPPVVSDATEPLWFLGTLVRLKLTGEQTGGRFALWEAVLPHGAAPPLHSHPQAETFYVLEGVLSFWLVDPELAKDQTTPRAWLDSQARSLSSGAAALAPAGAPHTFRVESDTARMLFLSTPPGIEDYVRALAEPARWPWLQPPPEGPRVPAERITAIEREHHVIRYGPAPVAEQKENQ